MPRSARASAAAVMKECDMPAPAPWANMQQALAPPRAWSRPETLAPPSSAIDRGSGEVPGMLPLGCGWPVQGLYRTDDFNRSDPRGINVPQYSHAVQLRAAGDGR